jgi:hypothetical protein
LPVLEVGLIAVMSRGLSPASRHRHGRRDHSHHYERPKSPPVEHNRRSIEVQKTNVTWVRSCQVPAPAGRSAL